jgi:hypothetical protein
MKKLILFLGLVLFGCNTSRKPDLVIDGREYSLNEKCIKSHQETKFCYHYGWNSWKGKFEFHWGNQTKTICDSTRIDTIEINLKEKYYKK